jgi:FK506-binding protein 4/5
LICLQGAKYVEYDTQFPDVDEKKAAKELKISLNLNDAACKLKMKNFPEVIDLTTKVYSLKIIQV